MIEGAASGKSAEAYRTITEVAEDLKVPQHVLRFWETRFPQVKPLKRAGGRRFYRPEDVTLLRAIKTLLYGQGYTIRGVQRLMQEQGPRGLAASLPPPAAANARLVGPQRGEEVGLEQGGGVPVAAVSALQAAPPAPRHEPIHHRPASEVSAPQSVRPPAIDGLLARLDAVASDLAECRRLIAAVRAARD